MEKPWLDWVKYYCYPNEVFGNTEVGELDTEEMRAQMESMSRSESPSTSAEGG